MKTKFMVEITIDSEDAEVSRADLKSFIRCKNSGGCAINGSTLTFNETFHETDEVKDALLAVKGAFLTPLSRRSFGERWSEYHSDAQDRVLQLLATL